MTTSRSEACHSKPDPLAGLPVYQLTDAPWRYALQRAVTPGAPLLIAAHGSDRNIRCLMAGLGLEGQVSVLAPLFPAEIDGENTGDDYKFLTAGGADYLTLMDLILAEALTRLGAAPRQIWLFGFSGGAQFAQRYALFRAAQLDGLILAAPGGVTLLREDVDWWPGLRGAVQAVGAEPGFEALMTLRTAILVGAQDRAAGMVSRAVGTKFGARDAGLAGETRIDKARALHRSLSAHGAPVTYAELPGVGHKLAPCIEAAAAILRDWLTKKEASTLSKSDRRHR
ncbi:alpha/beta hydrolase [Leisingera sp.]|uniref:alpha/beta hydrolase n=1 Tax=Leisingera sp. TaxID=1879318 RepID=UPI002B278D5A|nr:alpha/beta hydrolase [Leisingera sp.]